MKYRGGKIGRRGMLAAAGSLAMWDSSAKAGAGIGETPQSLPALARWIDRLRSPTGGEMVGIQQSGKGAITRTAQSKARDVVSVKDFGATGGNAALDTAAINAAIDTGSHVFFPIGVYSYVPSGKALAFGQVLYGESPLTTRIAKVDRSGDMFTMAAGSGLRDIGLQGNGGILTGRGLVIGASTANITLQNVNILDMNGYTVEVTANNGGSQLRIIGGIYDRTDPALAAIQMPSGDTQATPRHLVGVSSTGVLIDTAGADSLLLTGIYTRDVFFGAASKKVILSGSRISTLGGVVTVKGTDNVVTGNAVAGSITIHSGAATCVVSGNVVVTASSNTDNSAVGANTTDFRYRGSKTYDPGSIADGAAGSTTVTCTGAKMGMIASAAISMDQAGLMLAAYVSAPDTVTVRYQNESGGTVDLGSHTLRVEAR
jgi:hypothetical protein